MSNRKSPEEIADRLMAPSTASALWTHDQVRRLIIEAAKSAPFTSEERIEARVSLRMIRDAIEQLFGPAASLDSEEGVLATKGPLYRHEAEAIIEALQRIHDRSMNL